MYQIILDVPSEGSDCNFEERVIFMIRVPIGKEDGIRSFQDLYGVLDRKTAGSLY